MPHDPKKTLTPPDTTSQAASTTIPKPAEETVTVRAQVMAITVNGEVYLRAADVRTLLLDMATKSVGLEKKNYESLAEGVYKLMEEAD